MNPNQIIRSLEKLDNSKSWTMWRNQIKLFIPWKSCVKSGGSESTNDTKNFSNHLTLRSWIIQKAGQCENVCPAFWIIQLLETGWFEKFYVSLVLFEPPGFAQLFQGMDGLVWLRNTKSRVHFFELSSFFEKRIIWSDFAMWRSQINLFVSRKSWIIQKAGQCENTCPTFWIDQFF